MYVSLLANILPLSKSKTPLDIVNEWDFVNSYSTESGDNCICGHDIHEVCLIKNKHTDQVIKVGNCCVKYFTEKITELDRKTFTKVSFLRDKNTREERTDLIDCLVDISTASLKLFNEIRLNRNPYTGIAIMDEFTDYSTTQMTSIYRRVIELQKVGLITKLMPIDNDEEITNYQGFKVSLKPEKFSYMINPYYIMPKTTKHVDTLTPAVTLWKKLLTLNKV